MIRPFTCVCFFLACGSGLYLYQAKHRVQVLDREIEKTVRATNEMRERIRVMHAEWTLQNDPQRLQILADQFLTLKTVTPGQFTTMADLDNRIPAIRAPEPPAVEDEAPPVVAVQPTLIEEPKPVLAAAPPPAKPAVTASAPPRAPEQKPPRPVVAEAQQPAPRPVPIAAPRPVHATEPPRPMLATAPLRPISPTLAGGGSALGMARGSSAPPPPQPMPVSASQWVANGGGG